jgi:peptidoglycan hydrolase-like protein with peptidoglycan-binding domain
MPWMNRITWSGTALHAGVVPGYPASHGCIRLPFSFAPKLFQITTVGDNVVVTRDRLAPQPIEHPNLFQPLPPPPPPAMVKQEQPPQRQSSIEILPAPAAQRTHPGMLAKADLGGSTTDVPSSLEADAVGQSGAPTLKADDAAAVEDTHVHAFDPFVDLPATASTKSETTASASGHALDEHDGNSDKSDGVSAASLDKAPVAAPAPAAPPATPVVAVSTPAPLAIEVSVAGAEPIPVKVEATPAKVEATATPAVEPATAIATQAAAPVEPVVAATPAAPVLATPAPEMQAAATPAPAPAVQAVAATPQASMAEANAQADTTPTIIATKLGAGTKAAALQAAEPRSKAPLRILVTRRTQHDRIIGLQQILFDMGYLPPQDFDGTLGRATANAIKTFQKANAMPETGAFSEDLVRKVYQVAGKGEPPIGHMFVRQEFGRVFDAPVNFKDPETPLGTHVFTAMKFGPGDTKTQWTSISLQGDDSTSVLDRLEISSDVRQKISERLTPGSSLIIGDTAINSATLPKGGDFLVWAKDTPAKITSASIDDDVAPTKPKKKSRNVRRYNYDYSYRSPRSPSFSRGYPAWPW